MSLSIAKLLDLASASQNSNDKLSKSLKPAEVPDRYQNVSPSQYYNSVKRIGAGKKSNNQNILMKGTPDGSSAMPRSSSNPTGKLEDPKGFMEDGDIDPENIRKKRDPLHALPDNFYAGNDGFLYGLPPSTLTESNQVSLLQKARGSYYSRLTLFQPKQVQNTAPAPKVTDFQPHVDNSSMLAMGDQGMPPDYDAIIGTDTNNKSFINDSIYA
jgi:hypothetical protein